MVTSRSSRRKCISRIISYGCMSPSASSASTMTPSGVRRARASFMITPRRLVHMDYTPETRMSGTRGDNGLVTAIPSPSTELAGWRHVYSGKVRDLYMPAETPEGAAPERLLVVASDRVSAFDHVLSPGIPGKGELLTTLSLWWFDRLAGADGGRSIPNHLAASHELTLGADGEANAADDLKSLIPEAVTGRAMVVKSLDMLPIECVVRGYLTGSGWAEYQAGGTVCGIALPEGLSNGDRLPEPIYTPAYKAPMGEHDEN